MKQDQATVVAAHPGWFVLIANRDRDGFHKECVIAWEIEGEGTQQVILPITIDLEINLQIRSNNAREVDGYMIRSPSGDLIAPNLNRGCVNFARESKAWAHCLEVLEGE
jgi:hypothetical protein